MAAAQGPLHAIRGTGEAEKMLKNAKTEYHNEFEEIATYTGIEALAEAVNDKETAKLARGIRREEERMAKFLEKQIPQLAKAVAKEEIPAAERRNGSVAVELAAQVVEQLAQLVERLGASRSRSSRAAPSPARRARRRALVGRAAHEGASASAAPPRRARPPAAQRLGFVLGSRDEGALGLGLQPLAVVLEERASRSRSK